MDECMESLKKSAVFLALDVYSGYWKEEFEETNQNNLLSTSHDRLFRFPQMPFGLKKAPETFQRAITVIP